MRFWLRFWNPSRKFYHGINWNSLCLVFSDWRIIWIFLLEYFCKCFIFLIPLLLKQKILKRDLWELLFNFALSVIGNYDPVSLQISCRKWDPIKETDRGLNYGKFICNIFGRDPVKIGTFRAKVDLRNCVYLNRTNP